MRARFLLTLLSVSISLSSLGGCSKALEETLTETPSNTPINIVLPSNDNETSLDSSWLSVPSYISSEFTTSWFANGGDGSISMTNTYNQISANVIHGGSGPAAVTISRQGFNFDKGQSYIFSGIITSTIERDIQIVIADPSTYTPIVTFNYHLRANQPFSLREQFVYDEVDLSDTLVMFYLGGYGETIHDVTIQSFTVTTVNPTNTSVKVDQLGYMSNQRKVALFSYNEGDCFRLIDANSNVVVYEGEILSKGYDVQSGDTLFYGDFSTFNQNGSYYIETQIGGISPVFTISDRPYAQLQDSLLYLLYLQRCGQDIDSKVEGYSHLACHQNPASVLHISDTYDLTGGWHDAGDYGKYVNTGSKTVLDLLLAYSINPGLYSDDTGISESGNGISDILDEARYELEWIIKMQSESGVFASKVATQLFADMIGPTEDHEIQYVMHNNRSDITALASAVLMYASQIYQPFDTAFASQCSESAQKGYEYLQQNPESKLVDVIEPGFEQGNYNDISDVDNRFLLETIFYYVTADQQYLTNAFNYLNNEELNVFETTWRNVGGYGLYFLYKAMIKNNTLENIEMVQQRINDSISLIGNTITNNGYNYSNDGYGWGSNGETCDDALFLALMYDLTNNQQLKDLAFGPTHYLFGRNSLNICFVSGFGTNYPHNLHHRVAIANNNALYVGALVGGPDEYCEDEISMQYCGTLNSAKMYFDNVDSYSTNEMSIYWNGSLIALLAILTK